jgi:hypothetical protein
LKKVALIGIAGLIVGALALLLVLYRHDLLPINDPGKYSLTVSRMIDFGHGAGALRAPSRGIVGKDGWGHEMRYEAIELADRSRMYFVGSPGRDGKWERQHLADYVPGATTSFDDDIIYSNGKFLRSKQ